MVTVCFGFLADTGKILKVIFVGPTMDTTPIIAEEITVSYKFR
jgi:hypothetical protein